MNWGMNKVIGENETGFRGRHDFLYRSEAWDFLLAGGGLYNNLDYSFTPGHPDGTFRDYRSPGGGSPELRKQLGILKRYLEGLDFIRMKPDSTAIKERRRRLLLARRHERTSPRLCDLRPHAAPENRRESRIICGRTPLPRWSWTCPRAPVGRMARYKRRSDSRTRRFRAPGGHRLLRSPVFGDDVALKLHSVSDRDWSPTAQPDR